MFHTPAHKQSTSLVMLREALATPLSASDRALVAEFTDSRQYKIDRVVAATGATAQVAIGYLQAEEWFVDDAITSLLGDRRMHIERGNDLVFPRGNEHGEFCEPLWLASIDGGPSHHGRTPGEAAQRCLAALRPTSH